MNTDYIRIEDNHSTEGRISIGLTRYNTTPLTGTGKIVTLKLPIKKNAQNGWLKVNAVPMLANDKTGNIKTINAGSDSVLLITGQTSSGLVNYSPQNLVSIYPNPTSGIFTVSISDNNTHLLKLTDVMGREVKEISVTGSIEIEVGNLPAGIYFIQLMGGGLEMNKRIVINR